MLYHWNNEKIFAITWMASPTDAKYINQVASGRFTNWLKQPVFRHFLLTLAQADSG